MLAATPSIYAVILITLISLAEYLCNNGSSDISCRLPACTNSCCLDKALNAYHERSLGLINLVICDFNMDNCCLCEAQCVGAIFFPRRHHVVCYTCSTRVTRCPSCKVRINNRIFIVCLVKPNIFSIFLYPYSGANSQYRFFFCRKMLLRE